MTAAIIAAAIIGAFVLLWAALAMAARDITIDDGEG